MPGKAITEQQVKLYMKARSEGATQLVAAAKAGVSERSARRLEQGRPVKPPRHWRTRRDPFEAVWPELEAMLEGRPQLSAKTLLEFLQEQYPGGYPDALLRTLQRRVKQWKALSGPAKPVIFRQHHAPGVMGISDFTLLKNVTIHVGGEPLAHLLYHFRLVYCGWSYAKVIVGGESFTALAEGLQEALWRLGGAPQEHRTDSLSAAYRNLSADERDDVTTAYDALCAHYAMVPSRNNRGVSHENGAIEGPHGHLKRRIEQALLLRGSTDFDSVLQSQRWLDQTIVRKVNQRADALLACERPYLNALPARSATDYTEMVVRVTTASTITVRCITYTVPSRLIGERVRVHLFDDRLEGFIGSTHTFVLPRIYPLPGKRRARRVDYRHVIDALVKKPRAFLNSVYRDELLPTAAYQRAYVYWKRELAPAAACKLIVGALALAARYDCEQALSDYLAATLEQAYIPSLLELERRFGPPRAMPPHVTVSQHPLADYDALMPCEAEVAHG